MVVIDRGSDCLWFDLGICESGIAKSVADRMGLGEGAHWSVEPTQEPTRYKKLVRKIARSVLKKPLNGGETNVIIDYFHSPQRRFDIDNVSKCILDALNGIAYKDDKSVRWQTSVSRFLGEPLSIKGGPVDLVKPLKQYDSYVFIRLRVHPRLFS